MLLSAYLTIGVLTGQWTIGNPMVENKVQLTIRRSASGSNMTSSWTMPLSRLHGLTRAELDSSGSVARFEIIRDAGTMRFEGYLRNGSGGGAFTFSPNPNFATEMRALGYPDLSDEKIFVMAMHDVSAAQVKELKNLGYSGVKTDDLIAMAIHGVTPAYIRKTRSRGLGNLPVDQLVSLRIHGILE